MANFKAHTTLGLLWGIFVGVTAFLTGLCSLSGAVVAFFLASAGAAAPDVDCNTGRPREMVLSFLGLLVSAGIVVLFYKHLTTEMMLAAVLTAFFVTRYLGELIMFCTTRHRGIWHSFPMALLMAEIVYLLFFDMKTTSRLVYAAAVFGGFVSHLMLDEMYSFKFFGLLTKSSSGSACKFSSRSPALTLFIYFLVFAGGVCCILASRQP